MNFLAHAVLSGNDDDLLFGNFIADTIKGNKWQAFPKEISDGILLHRKIDFYTDTHPLVSNGKKLLYPQFSKYSPVIMDVILDYFLAKNFEQITNYSLRNFTQRFYEVIKLRSNFLNEKAAHIFHFMSTQDWLFSYKEIDEIEKILFRMSKRMNATIDFSFASVVIKNNEEELERDFFIFFSQISDFCQIEIEILRGNHV